MHKMVVDWSEHFLHILLYMSFTTFSRLSLEPVLLKSDNVTNLAKIKGYQAIGSGLFGFQ